MKKFILVALTVITLASCQKQQDAMFSAKTTCGVIIDIKRSTDLSGRKFDLYVQTADSVQIVTIGVLQLAQYHIGDQYCF